MTNKNVQIKHSILLYCLVMSIMRVNIFLKMYFAFWGYIHAYYNMLYDSLFLSLSQLS